ncbi:GNAT family N-acetyltransferase [Fusibacter sp. 3D3]|uniref:GNAT family N-acetyltransferase n=1 Tax=Fusibacter sp. 3D3 TaxID=1048380 RepID=UPI0008529EFF|nr:GNAT family N-acetyltransferase [Fusibacter sp. 3D3]GAU76599.1 predicted acetyltransferase [Fusibacter sp. 3D3]
MYTKKEIIEKAKAQLALDYNCQISDFEKEGNTIAENRLLEGRRIYESDGCFLKIVCIGGRAIISADEKLKPWLEEKLVGRDASWLFDFFVLRAIDQKLGEFGHEIDRTQNFYLPNPECNEVKPLTEIKWFDQEGILQFEGDERFDEAFLFEADSPDVIGVAALDGEHIMGMAGASRDCEGLYQIGINVLPEYEGRGIGTNLVAIIKQALLSRDIVPFYGTQMSHLISRNTAINAGFFPAWSELCSRKMD